MHPQVPDSEAPFAKRGLLLCGTISSVATHNEMLVITGSDSAAGFASVAPTTHQALLVCEDKAIRWRADGTDPTSSVGVLMQAGDSLSLMGSDYQDMMRRFKIINVVSGQVGKIQGAGFSGLDRA